MATTLYLRYTSSSITNLPTTEQSSLTSNKDGESQTINRTLSTTKGTSETNIILPSNASSAIQNYYFSKFVSDTLNMSSISVNTWTYAFAATGEATAGQFPVAGTNQPIRVNCYVWRPSTQAKIGTILDGNTASTVDIGAANTKVSHVVTFSGSAVSSMLAGDVLIFEVWFIVDQSLANSYDDTFYFDGVTNPTENGSEASAASYIQTPETLVFGIPPIDMTNVSVTGYTNKFILKV